MTDKSESTSINIHFGKKENYDLKKNPMKIVIPLHLSFTQAVKNKE